MHELLRQGGEEAKVIEIQNNDLQNQLDLTADQLAVATQSRERLRSEVSQLRMEIAIMRDELKSREEVITVTGNEVCAECTAMFVFSFLLILTDSVSKSDGKAS